jgi:Ribosomal protein HS6-type (S12/L30/L7a)
LPGRLKNGKKLVGVKQSGRALSEDKVLVCYIAADAEVRVTSPVRNACAEKSVEVVEVSAMSELGGFCGIETGASVAVLLK